MSKKVAAFIVLLALFASMVVLPNAAQVFVCTPDMMLKQTDVLQIERLMLGCSFDTKRAIVDQAQRNIDSGSLSDTQIAAQRTAMAIAFADIGDLYNARLAVQDALTDWRTAGDKLQEGRILFVMGTIFEQSGQDQQANTFYATAVDAAQRNDDTFTEGRVKIIYAERDLANSNEDGALGLLQDALPLLLGNATISVPEQIKALRLLSTTNKALERMGISGAQTLQANFLDNNPDWYVEAAGVELATACPFEDITTQTDFLLVEHSLSSCSGENAGFTDALQALIDNTSDAAERGRLQTLISLVYFARGDGYNAALNHERALLKFREVGDTVNEGVTLFYMARAYFSREQFDNVRTFLGQAEIIAEKAGNSFELGRIYLLQAKHDIKVNNDYANAVLTLESALKFLQTSGDISKLEQIETLQLLNQGFTVLGNPERAGNYLRLVQTLRGDDLSGDGQGTSRVETVTCEIENVVNLQDAVYVERQMKVCQPAQLQITALTWYYMATDPRSQGLARLYAGYAQSKLADPIVTYEELDKAVLILRQVGDQQLLGLAYYYIALNEQVRGISSLQQIQTYFSQAQDAFEAAGDGYNVGRVQLEYGYIENDAYNFNGAVTFLESALSNFQTTTTFAKNEKIAALNKLINIYVEFLQQPQRADEYRAQLDAVQRGVDLSDVVTTVATPVPDGTTSTTTTTSPELTAVIADCDPVSIAAESDLVVIDKRIIPCVDVYEELLFQVETGRQQASADADIAFWQDFLGLVHFYMGEYQKSYTEHVRAVFRYRELAEAVNEGRSSFWAGRSYFAAGQSGDASGFLNSAARIGKTTQDARLLAMLAIFYANNAYDDQEIEEAIEQYTVAAEQLELVNDPQDLIFTLLRLGQIQDERSNFEVALAYFQRVAELAQEIDDSSAFVQAQVRQARYHKYFRRYTLAKELAQDALDAATTPTDNAIARLEVADVARLEEDYSTARDILDIDPIEFDCETGDLIRLYVANLYVSVGRAANALEQVRPIFEPSTCPERSRLTVAQAYAVTADAQLLRRRSDQFVLDAVNETIREYDQINYPRGYESARIQMGTLFFFQRNYEEAERWLSTAEKKALEVNDLKAQADIQSVRVEISIERGRYTEALDNLAKASAIYDQLEFLPGLSSTLEQRLRIYLDQARYDEAIALIEFAQENYDTISISFDSRISYYQGRYYEQIGQSELALTYYDTALVGFQRAEEILSVLDVQLQKARIIQKRGDFEQVETLLDQMRPVAIEEENDFYLAQINAAQGDNYVLAWSSNPNRTSGDTIILNAQAAYETGLVNFTTVNNVAGQARVNNSLGELELLRVQTSINEARRYRGSNEASQRALGLYRVIGNSLGAADALYSIARYFLLGGDYENAEAYFYRALEELGDNEPLRRANILTGVGQVYEGKHLARGLGFGAASNDLYIAIEQYTTATQLLAFTYAEISNDDSQKTFGTQDETLAPYNRLLRIYAVYTLNDRTQDAIQALFFSEQSRARSYLTQLQGEDLQVGDSGDNSALTEWQGLRQEVINLNQQLADITARSGDAAETDTITAQVNEKLAQMRTLEAELGQSSLQAFVSVEVTDLPTLQAALPDDTLMIIYYVLPAEKSVLGDEAARLLMLLVSKNGIEKVSQRVEDYEQDLVNQINAYLRNFSDVASNAMYKLLITPIETQIAPYKNLIIVPHSVLNYRINAVKPLALAMGI